jgi:hypothetical protein
MIGRPVNLRFKGMTVSALDGRRLILVRDLTDVRMAGSAKVLAVNRMGVLLRSYLVMTGQAIFVLDFLEGPQDVRAKGRNSHQAKKKNGEYFGEYNPQGEMDQRSS